MSAPNNFTFGEGASAPTNDRTETQSVSIPPETTLADMFVIVREIRKEQIDKYKEQEILNKQFTAFMAASRDQNARPSRRSNSTSSHSSADSPSRRRRHRSHERRVSINPLRDNLPSTSAIHPNAPQVLINPFGNNKSTPAPTSEKQKLGPKNYLQSIPYFDELSTDLTEILRSEDVRDKEATKRVLNNDLINGFVYGLQHKYLNRFSTVSFLDLNSAFTEGRRVDKQLTDFPQLCPNEQECFVAQINNTTHPKPIYNNAENSCTFCHNYGRTIDICRKRQWHEARSNEAAPYETRQKPTTQRVRITTDRPRTMGIRETPIRSNEPAQRLGPTTTRTKKHHKQLQPRAKR
ncbi:hypothetical protein PV325_008774 [Microctonus aethiopoides]|nr:hypothetical protein PV325_008774 [Microctonus aethiopoides]